MASAAEAGLPRASPSRSSIESHAITRALVQRSATASPLRPASTWTAVTVSGVSMLSSTPLTTTSGANPPSTRTRRRADDAEASTSRGASSFAVMSE